MKNKNITIKKGAQVMNDITNNINTNHEDKSNINKEIVKFDLCEFMFQKNYFSNEIRMRNEHFKKYIEIWIDDYLNGTLVKHFEYEYAFRQWNNFEQSVVCFIKSNEEIIAKLIENKWIKKEFENFKVYFLNFKEYWLNLRRKNKNGEWIDGSSKFQTLVRKVMKEQNFEKRINLLSS